MKFKVDRCSQVVAPRALSIDSRIWSVNKKLFFTKVFARTLLVTLITKIFKSVELCFNYKAMV